MPDEVYVTQTTMIAVVAGIAAAAGVFLGLVGLVGWRTPPRADDKPTRLDRLRRRLGRRGVLALLIGVVVAVATGWIVLGLATVALVIFWDDMFGGAASEKLSMRKVEALALWTESLRDTIAGAVGLEQAIPASARNADPVLRGPLEALIDRLRGRMPLPEALQLLADELNDASADLVIAALMLNARLRGPGLREVLGALAASAREEVEVRQRVMAGRAGTRRSVQIIVGVIAAFMIIMALFNRDFVAPYRTLLGEMVLLVVIGLFAAGFLWLRKLSEVETPDRFLTAPGRDGKAGSASARAAAEQTARAFAAEQMTPSGAAGTGRYQPPGARGGARPGRANEPTGGGVR